MTKKDLVRALAEKLGISQGQARAAIDLTLDHICKVICQQGRIELRNFGVFEVKTRAARKARNPRTNVPVEVPARRAVTFQPGKHLADVVAGLMPIPKYH